MWLVRCGKHSERLREATAAVASMMANKSVPWEHIRALMANRLIALDKCPGLRPIGVGECLRRMIGKNVMEQTGLSLKEECGSDQLASNLEGGIEGAVHAMNEIYSQMADLEDGFGVLLVDAKNAFNIMNRKAALWNALHLWPHAGSSLPVQHVQRPWC
jgi:hypothetical protein